MKVILTQDQKDLFKIGTKIIDRAGNEWCYFPFWVKMEGNNVELFSPEQLPDHIKKQIEAYRNGDK